MLPISIPFVIALNFYMVGMQSAVWTYKNTMGLFRQGRYLLIVTAAINLVCSIWLGKMWGLFGILFATAISRALTNTWYDPYAVFKYGLEEKVSIYFKKYGQYALILLLAGAICYGICALIHISALVDVILKFVICCVVPNLVFFLCFTRKKNFSISGILPIAFFAEFLKSKVHRHVKPINRHLQMTPHTEVEYS